ncbi:hypothetical protein ACFQE1_00435 [Halobium palmae]|uniref:Uncharacterized protein n=1 Tax=Halobium palmae TaxID=1776492 RepID=A0ABD5RVE8_9EURY
MPTEHFDRLGTLASAIFATGDRIVNTDFIDNSAPGARFIAANKRGVPYRMFAHPSNHHISIESTYRPSRAIRNDMRYEDATTYAETHGIEAEDPDQLWELVVENRLMRRNRDVDIEEVYTPITTGERFSTPHVTALYYDESGDIYDGVAVADRIYPSESDFSVSKFDDIVSEVIDTRLQYTYHLYEELGLNEMDDDPTEQEAETTSDDRLVNHGFQ